MSRLRTNVITNRMANGAPTVSNGLVISGVTTTSEIFVGNNIKLDPISGIVTATSFVGSGANLTGIDLGAVTGATGDFSIADKIVHTGDTNTAIRFPTNDVITFETAGSERLRITNDGKIGFYTNSPMNRFQIGNHTFHGGHGMYESGRVGMSNHGSLTGLMLASTYNDAGVPEYGLVFVQGPDTSNYNCWSISPDGPAKGNSLSLHYGAQNTNIHILSNRKFEFDGDGDFNIIDGNLNASSGVGTFGGGVTIGYDTTTYSPIQKSDNTWFYTRLDQSSSISGTNIINLAQGSSKISDSIPRSVMTRQSDAGSYSLYHSSTTNGSAVTNFSAADPFSPRTYGLTMGCLVRLHESGNNGSGVIFYGDTNSDNHFFVRYKYSSGGLRVGEDTDGSDNWSLAYPTDRFTNDNWYFVVFAVAGNGTLYVSLNGEEKIPIRTVGSPPTPTDARFGICGDPYADNDSRHRYATMFWYKGLMPNDMIKAEYDWLKTIWTGASLP